jgi:hypothetical protein
MMDTLIYPFSSTGARCHGSMFGWVEPNGRGRQMRRVDFTLVDVNNKGGPTVYDGL